MSTAKPQGKDAPGTVAQEIVKTLADAGIKHLYAITGDSLNAINDAIREDGRIEWIHMRHEESGAFAASAEAQLTGKLACCAGSSGPGHVHLVNGLYDANRAYAPVVAIATTCASTQMGTQYFQETNTDKLFADCSIYNRIAVTPVEASRMLHGAIQAAAGEGGVGVLGLPGDIALMPAEPSPSTEPYLPTSVSYEPAPQDVKAAADIINRHGKILLYCGIGCKDAHKQVMEFAEFLKAPVACALRGKSSVLYDCPNSVGNGGGAGLPSAYHAVSHCDLMLMLGCDTPYSHFVADPDKGVEAIQVDIRPQNIGRRIKVAQGVCGDVGRFIEAVTPLITPKTDDSFLKAELAVFAQTNAQTAAEVADKGTPMQISPQFVTAEIDRLAADDAIFTVDTGLNVCWAARQITANGRRSIIGSFSHGSMADAMPMAIGAALACPGRQVISMSGDGGISMLLGDLATIVQYKLPIKIVVYDNRTLGFVQMEMETAGIPVWQTDMLNPDFAKTAEAMGFYGVNVTRPEDVTAALEKAFAVDGPALVSIFTRHDIPVVTEKKE